MDGDVTTTDLLTEWRAHLHFWGWAICGREPTRLVLRNPASILEARDQWEPGWHPWDRKPEGERWDGTERLPIPDWWAIRAWTPEQIQGALEAESVVRAAERIVEGR